MIVKISGKTQGNSNFGRKTLKTRVNVYYVAKSRIKIYSREFFSLALLREKFENALEISGKTQGNLVS